MKNPNGFSDRLEKWLERMCKAFLFWWFVSLLPKKTQIFIEKALMVATVLVLLLLLFMFVSVFLEGCARFFF